VIALIDLMARPDQITYDASLLAANADRLSKLVDHPVMNIYYAGVVPSFRPMILARIDDDFAVSVVPHLSLMEE
jgi:hypothetical protein